MQHPDDTPKRRGDTRQWDHRPKYGRRLQRQGGPDRFKSKVPDPARPGADRTKSFQASGWQEAERVHRERLGKADSNELPENPRLTLDELAERRWTLLEGLVASGERAERTPEAEKALYEKHIRPRLGRLRVERMQSGHVSNLLAELRKSGLAAGSIQRIFSVLRSILNLDRTGAGVILGLTKA